MDDERDQKPVKFPQIWKIPDPPGMEERTSSVIFKHDDVKNGDLIMIVTSSAVKLDITQQGPKITRVDNDPAYNGVSMVMAYCFPFIAVRVITGPMKGERIALDVRRHKMIKVSKRFCRALMKPEPQQPPLQDVGGGLVMTPMANGPDAMTRIADALRGGGWRPVPNPEGGEEPFFPPDNLPPPDEDEEEY